MTTVFSISPLREVHDINVKSKNGRKFVIDVYRSNTFAMFNATITAHDHLQPNAGSWLYEVKPLDMNAPAVFQAAIDFIIKYLTELDSTDSIFTVSNPCNFPFISLDMQNLALTNREYPPIAE